MEVHRKRGILSHLRVCASSFIPRSSGPCLDNSILRVPGSLGKFPETGSPLFSRKEDGNWGDIPLLMCRAIKPSMNGEENEPFGVTWKQRCVAPFLRTGVKYRGAQGQSRALYVAAGAPRRCKGTTAHSQGGLYNRSWEKTRCSWLSLQILYLERFRDVAVPDERSQLELGCVAILYHGQVWLS